jgi:hypothetical protein
VRPPQQLPRSKLGIVQARDDRLVLLVILQDENDVLAH